MSRSVDDSIRSRIGFLDVWAVTQASDAMHCGIAVYRGDEHRTFHELLITFNGAQFCRITHESQEEARLEAESLLAGYLARGWVLRGSRSSAQ